MCNCSPSDTPFPRVTSVALDQHAVHTLTLLSSIVAGIGSEADRNESHARNFARVEVLRQLAPVDPRSAEQFERGLSTSADRHVGSFDKGHPRIQGCLRKAAQVR